MYVSLWDWFNEYEVKARQAGDAQRLRLPDSAYLAWRYLRNIEPDVALQTFAQGRKHAQKLNEPAWELFFDLWCCEVLVYHKDDTRAALDHTIRVAARAHQPRYESFPVIRSQVFFVLSNLYFMIDPFGYADEIRELLDFTEKNVPMALDTHLRILSIRAGLYLEHEQYDQSRSATYEYLTLAQGNYRRMAGAHERLAGIAYAAGDMTLALEHSRQHEQFSQREDDKDDVALSWLWQAVYLQLLGSDEVARRTYFQGIWDFERMGYVRRTSYYDAVCTYLECTGNVEEALWLRREQLQGQTRHNSIVHHAKAHLQTCRLMGRMGQPMDEMLATTQQLSAAMRKPDWFLQRLQRIVDGDYHEYGWQRQQPRSGADQKS